MKTYEDMIQDRLENTQTEPGENLKNRVLSGAMSGTAPSRSSGKKRIGMRAMLAAVAIAVLSITVALAANTEQVRIILSNITNFTNRGITNSDYDPSFPADVETTAIPYAVKWPSYLPSGLTLTSARFHDREDHKMFYVAFNDRPDGSFDLYMQVTFANDKRVFESKTSFTTKLGKSKVEVYVGYQQLVTGNLDIIRMEWFDNGDHYFLGGPLDLATMTKIAESVINGQSFYPEVAVNAETTTVETPAPTPAPTSVTTTLSGDEAMPYAAKWPAYLPEGMKISAARASFGDGDFNTFFCVFNERNGGTPDMTFDLSFQIGVTTREEVADANCEITFDGKKVKANLATDVSTVSWSFKINRLQWIDNGFLYSVVSPFDVETLTRIAESVTDGHPSYSEVAVNAEPVMVETPAEAVEPPAEAVEPPAEAVNVTQIEYNTSVFADAGTKTMILPYKIKFPTYLPEGLGLRGVYFGDTMTNKAVDLHFSFRRDAPPDLTFGLVFAREASQSSLLEWYVLGKNKVVVALTRNTPELSIQWNDHGHTYHITGTFDVDTMLKVAESIIDSQPTYFEIAVDAWPGAIRTTSAP